MRGWMVRELQAFTGERALAAAMVRQALVDAGRGDADAAEWMDTIAPGWCEVFLGMDAERVRRWRTAEPRFRLNSGSAGTGTKRG